MSLARLPAQHSTTGRAAQPSTCRGPSPPLLSHAPRSPAPGTAGSSWPWSETPPPPRSCPWAPPRQRRTARRWWPATTRGRRSVGAGGHACRCPRSPAARRGDRARVSGAGPLRAARSRVAAGAAGRGRRPTSSRPGRGAHGPRSLLSRVPCTWGDLGRGDVLNCGHAALTRCVAAGAWCGRKSEGWGESGTDNKDERGIRDVWPSSGYDAGDGRTAPRPMASFIAGSECNDGTPTTCRVFS